MLPPPVGVRSRRRSVYLHEEASAGSALFKPAAGEPSHDRGAYVEGEGWKLAFRRFCWGGELVRCNLRNLTSLHPSLSHLLLSPDFPDTRHVSILSWPVAPSSLPHSGVNRFVLFRSSRSFGVITSSSRPAYICRSCAGCRKTCTAVRFDVDVSRH